MKWTTLKTLVNEGRLPVMLRLQTIVGPIYRASFLTTMGKHGLLELLAEEPCGLGRIGEHIGAAPEDLPMLEAWLGVGLTIGELSLEDGRYALAGWMARKLADPRHDPALATLEEVIDLHIKAITEIPTMLKERRRFGWDDYPGETLARMGPLFEPFNQEAIALAVPKSGPVRVLDMGCGIGRNLRFVAERNPDAIVTGLEIVPEVAAIARQNVAEWGLSDRVEVRTGDVRTTDFARPFDVIYSNSNIYYFAEGERVTLFERLRGMLAPRGQLMVSTICQGGSIGLEMVNVWFCAAQFGGPLPAVDALVGMMQAGGFEDVKATRLMPGEEVWAFLGRRT